MKESHSLRLWREWLFLILRCGLSKLILNDPFVLYGFIIAVARSSNFITERNPHRMSIAQMRYIIKRISSRAGINKDIHPHHIKT